MLHAVRPESSFEREAARLSYARSVASYAHPRPLVLQEAHQSSLVAPLSPSRDRKPPMVMVAPPSSDSTRCQQPGCAHIAHNPRELAHHVRAAHGLAASPPRSSTSRLRQRSPPPPRRPSAYNASQSRAASSANHGIIRLRSIQPPSTWAPHAAPAVRLQDVMEDEEMELDVRETSACSPWGIGGDRCTSDGMPLSLEDECSALSRDMTAATAPHNALAPSPVFSLVSAPSLSQVRSVTALEAIPEDEWSE
ncbi:hypothetical protein HDZ31DRAFT_32474 [Schizophyllum fasciatum]